MPKYEVKSASDIWDELKAKIPKLISGTFIGDELISFTTTEDLTLTELVIIEEATRKKWKKIE